MKKISNIIRISVVTAIISLSTLGKFRTEWSRYKIGHGIVDEDLGLDLRSAFGRFKIFKENSDLRFDHFISEDLRFGCEF